MGLDVNIAGGAPGTYQGLTHFGHAYEGHAPSRFATPRAGGVSREKSFSD